MAVPAPFTIRGSATQRVHGASPSPAVLRAEAERADARRVFILAGRTLATKTPHVRALEEALGARHAATFRGIGPLTPVEDVLAAIEAAVEARADMIVTIGGGAQSDAGKILVLALRAGVRTLADLQSLSARCGWDRIDVDDPALIPDLPLVSIPTTLSGGEFSAGGGAAQADGTKLPVMHRHCAPAAIILDPVVTLDTPADLWFSTGIRAVDHAVEALASLQSNPYCDTMAEAALRLLVPALKATRARPADLAARADCQAGVWLAMLPLLSGVPMGASHAIGHALGTVCGVSHGHTSCVLMPAVQRWNAPAIAARHVLIGGALGVPADEVPGALADLVRALGLPDRIAKAAARLDEPMLRQVARVAAPAHWVATNPRPFPSEDAIFDLLVSVKD